MKQQHVSCACAAKWSYAFSPFWWDSVLIDGLNSRVILNIYLYRNISVSFTEYLQFSSEVVRSTLCPITTVFVLHVAIDKEVTHLGGEGVMHASTDWMGVFTGWLCVKMKNKGQILKGSCFSSHCLSDTRCLVVSANTAVDYRSVCKHSVALYIFRNSGF